MKFDCPSCGAKYKISDEKLAGKKEIKVRCKKCNFLIRQKIEVPEEKATPSQGLETDHQATRILDRNEINKIKEQLGEENFEAPKVEGSDQKQQVTQTWYVFIDEKQVGPIGVDEVKELWDEKKIDGETFVWGPDLSDWEPLNTVDTLLSQLTADDPAAGEEDLSSLFEQSDDAKASDSQSSMAGAAASDFGEVEKLEQAAAENTDAAHAGAADPAPILEEEPASEGHTSGLQLNQPRKSKLPLIIIAASVFVVIVVGWLMMQPKPESNSVRIIEPVPAGNLEENNTLEAEPLKEKEDSEALKDGALEEKDPAVPSEEGNLDTVNDKVDTLPKDIEPVKPASEVKKVIVPVYKAKKIEKVAVVKSPVKPKPKRKALKKRKVSKKRKNIEDEFSDIATSPVIPVNSNARAGKSNDDDLDLDGLLGGDGGGPSPVAIVKKGPAPTDKQLKSKVNSELRSKIGSCVRNNQSDMARGKKITFVVRVKNSGTVGRVTVTNRAMMSSGLIQCSISHLNTLRFKAFGKPFVDLRMPIKF